MPIFLILAIAFSLSMDAFSLSLAYGTLNLSRKNIILLSIIVGMFHFFMPILGIVLGETITNLFKVSASIVIFVVLLFIGISMILESFKKNEEVKRLGFMEMILFGLAVSIDSFSVGIGLKAITNNYIISALCFSIFSFSLTFFGLKLGKKMNEWLGKISVLIGGICLITLSFVCLFK